MATEQSDSIFLSLHCNLCDNRELIQEADGKQCWTCLTGNVNTFRESKECDTAVVLKRKGKMTSSGFVRAEGETWC